MRLLKLHLRLFSTQKLYDCTFLQVMMQTRIKLVFNQSVTINPFTVKIYCKVIHQRGVGGHQRSLYVLFCQY